MPPGRATVATSTPTRRAPTASSSPPSSSRQADAAGRPPVRDRRPRQPRRLPRADRARGRAAAGRPRRSCRRSRSTRSRAACALDLPEGELHVLGHRRRPRRTRRSRRRSPRSAAPGGPASSRPSSGCARSGCRSTTRSRTWTSPRDDALGRPTLARALVAAGHAESVEDAFSRLLGHGQPGYVPRTGLGPGRGDPRDPGGRRPRRRSPTSARRPTVSLAARPRRRGPERAREPPPLVRRRDRARRSASSPGRWARRDRRHRLPWRPRDVRRGPRRPRDARRARRRRLRRRAGRAGARRTAMHRSTDRMTTRACPSSTSRPPAAGPAGPRGPLAPDDERLAEFRPEARALPRVLRLDARLPDEQERLRGDGRAAAGRRLRRGAVDGGGRPRRHQHLRDPRGRRGRRSSAARAHLNRLKAANPALRVVLTGCSVRESDRAGLERRYPAVDLFLRPDEEPELVDRLGLASAQAPVGAHRRDRRRRRSSTGAAVSRRRPPRPGTRADAIAGGAVRRGSRDPRLAADHLRLRQDVHLLHRPVQPRAGAEPPVRRDRRRGAGARRAGLPRGHAPRPERQLLRPRPARPSRGSGTSTPSAGRRPPPGPRRAARPRRAASARSTACATADGAPAIPRLRFVTSHPWDLSDRLIEAMRDCPSVCEPSTCPSSRGDDAMLRRMGRQYTIEHYLERLARIREAVPGIALSTDVIVGFCGETEAAVRGDAPAPRDRPLRPGLRGRLQRAARHARRRASPTTSRRPRSAAGSSASSTLQEGIGLERNRAWLGRDDRGPRGHRRAADARTTTRTRRPTGPRSRATRSPGSRTGVVHLAGRSRENKLVHFAGPGGPRRAPRRRAGRPRGPVRAAGRALA